MKKIILSAIAIMALGTAAQAQEGGFKVGIHGGIPIGDAGDLFAYNVGVDVAYLWPVADGLNVGVTTGYTHFGAKDAEDILDDEIGGGFGEFFEDFLDDVEVYDDAAYIPIAATAIYSLSDSFFIGADLGYGIYAGSGEGDGGVYYQPKVGWQSESIEVFASYKGISVDGISLSTIGVGAAYKF